MLRDAPPDAAAARAVAADLCALYNAGDEDGAALAEVFAQGIEGRTHLWLRYTE